MSGLFWEGNVARVNWRTNGSPLAHDLHVRGDRQTVVWQIANANTALEIGETPFFIHERRPTCIWATQQYNYYPDPEHLPEAFSTGANVSINKSEWGIDVVLEDPAVVQTIGTLVIGALENETFALEQQDGTLPRLGLSSVWGDHTYFALVQEN